MEDQIIMQSVLIILSAVFFFLVIMQVHEIGHFLVAKLFKVRVQKFSLGFGPKLIHKKIGETEYALALIPLVSYIKMNYDPSNPHAFDSQPILKRALIVVAGPFMNILFGALLFAMILSSGNFELLLSTNPSSVTDIVSSTDKKGPVINGAIAAAKTTESIATSLVTRDWSVRDVGGPLYMMSFAAKAAKAGVYVYFFELAIMSIAVGTLNLLPIPACDGGHLAFFLMEAIRGRKLNERAGAFATIAGACVMIAVTAVAILNDLTRMFGWAQ
ncbi:MAG: site-2 protease family protein [Dissulfurispiraceae bacterium]